MNPGILRHASFELNVQITVKRKNGVFVSYCPAFDLYSQGDTKEEAEKNIFEAAKLFINTSFERGNLDAVLKECGFKPVKRAVKSRKPKDHKVLTIPIAFKAEDPHPAVCHA